MDDYPKIIMEEKADGYKFSYKIATGMNEAKQYESLEKYLDRDDKIIAQKLANVIATVNVF